MNVPEIYNIYNIYRCYCLNILKHKISDVINSIVIISNNLNKLKILELIELSNKDIKYEICNKYVNIHNINIIQLQKSYKLINTLQLNTNNYEYYFKEINFDNSFIFKKIIENYNNIRYKIIYDLVNHKPIGIIKNKNSPSTLFQFRFFCKKLELILNKKKIIPLSNEEQISLFLNTDFLTFPVIFCVYEARNYILNNPKLNKNVYVREMIEYVRLKGFVVNMHVQNNQYVMGLVH